MAEQLGATLVDGQIAYLTSDAPADSPWVSSYRVTDVLPFSVKRLRAALRERGVGEVTIKKRGSAVDVERLRRDLRLTGDASAVVVLTRIGAKPYAAICTTMRNRAVDA